MEKKISVVIPTYKRAALLYNCLHALSHQTINEKDYEVIVVSDGHDLETEKIVRQLREQFLADISFFSLETRKGPAAARNMGWKNACSELIAFTDDDCLPSATWLQSIIERYSGEELIAYTGKVIVPLPEQPTDFALNTAGLELAEFVTANCIITKKALEVTGGFDEQFTAAWREDSDLHFKLMLNNVPIYKNDNAVVVHPVRPVPFGASVKEQKKNVFNALLYKKYPQLFRSRIKAKPNWFYYADSTFFSVTLFCCFASAFKFALIFFSAWMLFTLQFTMKRLSKTSKKPRHVLEMFITSMFIPLCSVYWNLYGAWKYRVLYL